MKPNIKTLIAYFTGFILLSAFLYVVILRHPGYIYFWDMSGSFDFNAPFDQYFYLFTPWDLLNVGVKNRLPLAIIIFVIFKPLQYLFGLSEMAVIKIAVTLLIMGAYTAFFFLFPRWLNILSRKLDEDLLSTTRFTVLRTVFSILYLLIPFFAYRLPQLHLFYLSIFYPIHCYLFIKLLGEDRMNRKLIALFVVTMFFGLTSPHIIIIELLTFIPIFILFVIRHIKARKHLAAMLKNVTLAAIGTILTNLYWLFPFLLLGTPEPGYVINDSMLGMLTQETTISNFLIGQSEWFIGQADLKTINPANSSLYIVQILGVATLYVFAAWFILKDMKRYIAIGVGVALAATLFIIVSNIPYQKEIYEAIVYSPLGWIVREVNKLYTVWAFWTFLLFALGLTSTIITLRSTDFLGKVTVYLLVPFLFLPYIVYIAPINITFFKYLTPVEIDETAQEVFDLFEEDKDYFYVYYHPRNEPYRISWKQGRFDIADSVDYDFLPYNSPKPPVYLSTVVPHAKSYTSLMTEYLFQTKDAFEDIAPFLNEAGVKYIVLRTGAKPIRLNTETAQKFIMDPAIQYLDENPSFVRRLTNPNYTVYENLEFKTGVDVYQRTVYSTDTFSILEHIQPSQLDNTKVVFCNFPENQASCIDTSEDKTFLQFDDNENFHLDLLTEEDRAKYTMYPYDHTHSYGINIDWGRSSYYDRINGELHNVFRNYSINAWNFDVSDKVAYSDHPFLEQTTSTMTFSETTSCTKNCNVYAFVLKNHIGGSLKLNLDKKEYLVDTLSEFETYRWVKLDEKTSFKDSDVSVTLTNLNGFNSIGGIVIIPDIVDQKTRNTVKAKNTVLTVSTQGLTELPAPDPKPCKLTAVTYDRSFIPNIQVIGSCQSRAELNVKAFRNHYVTLDRKQNTINDRDYSYLEAKNILLDIYLITYYDLFLWVLFIINASFVGMLAFAVLRPKKKKKYKPLEVVAL